MALAPTNLTTVSLAPEQGAAAETGPCRPDSAATIAVPRLVRARTLLDAADIERLERRSAGAGAGDDASPLLVFSSRNEKHVAQLDGLVPADAVAERLADGQVSTLAKVVGG